jgi:hypothetical protein
MTDNWLFSPPLNHFFNKRLFHWRLSMKRHPCRRGYRSGATVTVGRTFSFIILAILAMGLKAFAQQIPDVRCHTEDYPVAGVVTYWQSPDVLKSVQVVVLKDPAGEQEARFDLTHGGTLISLRYHGREVTYGKPGGANVSMYIPRLGTEETLKGLSPYWSSLHVDQGGSSMGTTSTVAGVACSGEKSFRAFAMMVDTGVDSSFQPEPLLAVWAGQVSNTFPPGYSTPFSIETVASWVKNPGKAPAYYLQLEQSVINVRPSPPLPLEWSLEGAVPWDYEHSVSYPERCTEKTPCTNSEAPAIANGRYQDAAHSVGFATVVPTSDLGTNKAFTRTNAEFIALAYGAGGWVAPRRVFGTAFSRDLEGVKALHFKWFICAGGWDQAQAYAKGMAKP